jgi:hypothetical protein
LLPAALGTVADFQSVVVLVLLHTPVVSPLVQVKVSAEENPWSAREMAGMRRRLRETANGRRRRFFMVAGESGFE